MPQRAATISASGCRGPAKNGTSSPYVPAGADVPQVAHQVDDPVQLVRLERENPLVVVQGEGADRVRPDVRVRAGRAAVLDEQPATLVLRQQVPLVRPHERVHGQVAARRLPRHERGDVRLVELGGAVQPHHGPDRPQVPAQRAAPELPVRLLHRLDVRRVPPHHQVGVRPQSSDVVPAAHHQVLAGEPGDRLFRLGRESRAVVGQGPGRRVEREHGPHRVADGLVDLRDREGSVRPSGCVMPRILPRRASSAPGGPRPAPRPPPARQSRCRRGCRHRRPPRPRAPARGRRRPRRARAPSRPRDRPPAAAVPPPQRTTRTATGRSSRPSRSPRSARASRARSASSRCSTASSPARPSEARTTASAGSSSSTQPHLLEAYVAAFTARPSIGGTSNPEPVSPATWGRGSSAATRRHARRRHAGRLARRERDLRAQQAGRGRRRDREHDGVGLDPFRPRHGARDQTPAGGRAMQLPDGHAGAHLHPRLHQPLREPQRQPAEPPAQSREDRPGALVPAGSALRRHPADGSEKGLPRAGDVPQGRNGGTQRQPVGAARVHASEQGLDEPVHDGCSEPARRRTRRRRRPQRPGGRKGRPAGRRQGRRRRGLRSHPLDLRRRQHAREHLRPAGDAHHGAGRQRMRHAVADDLRRRCGRMHHVGPQPEVGEQLERFGPPGEHGFGAEVDLDVPHRPDEELPPTRADCSSTTTRGGSGRRASRQAAVSPEMPPPTTTTVGRFARMGIPPLLTDRACHARRGRPSPAPPPPPPADDQGKVGCLPGHGAFPSLIPNFSLIPTFP